MVLEKEYQSVQEKIEEGLAQVVTQLRAVLNSHGLYDNGLTIAIRHPHLTAVGLLQEFCPSKVLRVPVIVENDR
jgi:hypothetical protein